MLRKAVRSSAVNLADGQVLEMKEQSIGLLRYQIDDGDGSEG